MILLISNYTEIPFAGAFECDSFRWDLIPLERFPAGLNLFLAMGVP